MFESAKYEPVAAPASHRFSIPSLGSRDRNVEIGGTFDGTFSGKAITITKEGSVSGDLAADVVEIYGAVRGSVRAEAIYVRGTGWVEGEMEYNILVVEPGATVNARCIPC